MAKIIGFASSSFTGDGGKEIHGVNVYLTEPLKSGDGLYGFRVYLTQEKVNSMEYRIKLGDEVHVEYNKYGKCAKIEKA